MEIYTSYFAKTKKLMDLGLVPISISLFPPKWFNGPQLRFLAPNRAMLSDSVKNDEYTRMYFNDILGRFDIALFRKLVTQYSGGKDVALCCFEKPGEFCHRRLFAEFVEEKFKYKISEYVFEEDAPKPEKKKEPETLSLF